MTDEEFYAKHYVKIAFSRTLTNIVRNRSGFGSFEEGMKAIRRFLDYTEFLNGQRFTRSRALGLAARCGARQPQRFLQSLNWLGYLAERSRGSFVVTHSAVIVNHPPEPLPDFRNMLALAVCSS